MLSGQEKTATRQKNRKYLAQQDSEIIPFDRTDADDATERKPQIKYTKPENSHHEESTHCCKTN